MFVAGLAVFLSLAVKPPDNVLTNPVNYGCSETLYVHWSDFPEPFACWGNPAWGADNRFYEYTDALATWIYDYYSPPSCANGRNRQLWDSSSTKCCESLPQNFSHVNAICQPESAEAVCAHATPVYRHCTAAYGCKATWFTGSVDCSSNLSTTTTPGDGGGEGEGGVSTGVIVGASVGGVAGLGVVGFIIAKFCNAVPTGINM